MTADPSPVIELAWHGPFTWPGLDGDDQCPSLDDTERSLRSGVYLWTIEHQTGFLIYAAGIARRPFRQRFREHNRCYRSGVYTIFDAPSLMRGERNKVWPGFWFRARTEGLARDYEARSPEIAGALNTLLASYRVFVAPLAPEARVLERIEAAIMDALYAAGGPAAAVPDRGMALSPRRESEPPIRVRSTAPVLLHGLPGEFTA